MLRFRRSDQFVVDTVPVLRHLRLVLVAILIVATVLFSHLILPSQASNLATDAIRSLHAPGFGLVSLVIFQIVRSRVSTRRSAYIRAAGLTMLLACLAEAAQIPTARTAQISDLLVDALGILGFLGTAALFDREMRIELGNPQTLLLSALSIPALLAAIWPTAWLCYALIMRVQALPQLASFDAPWERNYVLGEGTDPEIVPAPAGWPDGSGNVGRILSSGRFGLMLHVYPDPDWSQYSGVSFVAATENQESRRIAVGLWGIKPGNGAAQGRYYTRVRVGPVPTRHCINFSALASLPDDEKFDLSLVYELLIGATQAETGVTLLVDDFRLESQADNCQ